MKLPALFEDTEWLNYINEGLLPAAGPIEMFHI